jgi:hypothetical protein
VIKTAAQRYEIWAGLAVALLILGTTLDGYVVAGLALMLLVAGAVLFPALRRAGLAAALLAALAAAAAVLIQRAF